MIHEPSADNGNVVVAVRVRPLAAREQGNPIIVEMQRMYIPSGYTNPEV